MHKLRSSRCDFSASFLLPVGQEQKLSGMSRCPDTLSSIHTARKCLIGEATVWPVLCTSSVSVPSTSSMSMLHHMEILGMGPELKPSTVTEEEMLSILVQQGIRSFKTGTLGMEQQLSIMLFICRFTEFCKAKVASPGTEGQSSIDSFLTTTGVHVYSQGHPRQKAITEAILQDLIISCNLPMSLVDNPHFRHFMSVVDDKYRPVSRPMLTRRLHDLTLNKEATIKSALEKTE
ncbi:hypothetical protein J4Q44_G00225560 [Coregonus suidteri]|uniref:Uncharacterized protein n=1 Tax=Coregonus suidteri TaxID=861788 RepID=A0AAN8L8S5_9TELE